MPDRIKAPAIKSPDEYVIKLPQCEEFHLKNGAPVYFLTGGANEVFRIEWIFSAGHYFEDKPGVASAMNRLIMGGTSTLSSFELSRHFEFYGAFLSMSCHNEHAVVTLEGLSKYLRELLPVVAELFTDSVFPEHEIDILKQNSIQRLKVNLQKCEFVANREMSALLFGEEHPYGRKVGAEAIAEIQRDDIVRFFNEFYRDAECKIFAAGYLPDDFNSIMDEYFGALNLNSKKDLRFISPLPSPKRTIHIENDPNGVQLAIRISREFHDRRHPDFRKAMILNALLGGYFGSRLMSNIRENKGYTYGIYSYIQTFRQLSAWHITTEVGVDVSEAAIKEIFKELQRLCDEPASHEELRLVRNYLVGHQLASLDGPFNIIGRWKGLILNDLDEKYFNEVIQEIKTVNPKALQELANKYFVPDELFQLTVV